MVGVYDAEQSAFGRRDDHLRDPAGLHSGQQIGERFVGAHGGGTGGHDVLRNIGGLDGCRDHIDASEHDSVLVHNDDHIFGPNVGEDRDRLVGRTGSRVALYMERSTGSQSGPHSVVNAADSAAS